MSSETEDVLDVVERESGRIVRRVPIGKRPNNVAITPDGRRVYVCIREEAWVDVVDTRSLEREKRIPVGRNPHNVYCTPDGRHMIATSMGENKLTVISTRSEAPEFDIPLDGVPRPLAIDAAPGGEIRRLFVQLSDLHGFEVIGWASRKTVDKVLLPPAPPDAKPLIPHTFSHGIGITPDGRELWVTSLLNNAVSVFSLPDLKLLGSVPVGRGPDWLTFTPDGKRCFVSDAGSDAVSAIDVASRRELARIKVGKVPKRIIAIELP